MVEPTTLDPVAKKKQKFHWNWNTDCHEYTSSCSFFNEFKPAYV